jgi:ParB-like chromosome segregation protein Spo0J
MKLHDIPLNQIVPNPWRDEELYPVTDEQITILRNSIKDHGFFPGVVGRRQHGKIELACGHARFAAARKARLESIPVAIDDLDDDQMLRLMTDENATQRGGNAGAVMNEVAAVTRRLMEGLLEAQTLGTIVPRGIKNAFEGNALATAQGRLNTRRVKGEGEIPIGHHTIRTYLGQGNPDNSHRPERAIREAMSALKDSGRYDDIIDEVFRKHPIPIDHNIKPAQKTEIAKTKQPKPKRRILDERTANLFPHDHQFHAFREAVTTQAAQKFIPVEKQLSLAKKITTPIHSQFDKRQVGAPYIKRMVQAEVEDAAKKQRTIDKEERERFLAEQREERIDDELRNANASLRGLLSAIASMSDLARQFPGHPKLGGFSARLDTLVDAIKQFSKQLK